MAVDYQQDLARLSSERHKNTSDEDSKRNGSQSSSQRQILSVVMEDLCSRTDLKLRERPPTASLSCFV